MTLARTLMLNKNRLKILCAALFYMIAMCYSYDQYLSQKWEYFGFTNHPWNAIEYCFASCLIMWIALLIPIELEKPSSIVITALFLLVYVPTIVVTLSLNANSMEKYGWLLTALGFGFGGVCIGMKNELQYDWHFIKVRWRSFMIFMTSSWFLCVIILFYFYGSSMKFVGIEDTYTQRFAGRDIDAPGINYIQSLFINGVCSFFMAYGLICKKWIWFIFGVIGCIVLYAITAAKTVVALPVVFLAVNYIITRSSQLDPKIWWSIFVFGCIAVISTLTYNDSTLFGLIAALFIFRTLAIPGLTLSQYYDLFSIDGYTWWSNVKGVSLIIDIPASYKGDPLWPSLGLLVGDRIYGVTDLNANANLWANDGVAAAGSFGIIVISLLLFIWLMLLDQSQRSWNKKFVMLTIIPFSFSLTNGSLFTSILSFGGLFWFVVFGFTRRVGVWPTELCESNKMQSPSAPIKKYYAKQFKVSALKY